jgi:hypothetical protein
MAKAQWSVKSTDVKYSTDAAGTLTVAVGLYDNGVKAATLRFTITADRALTVLCENEPGSAGLTGFQAWSREASA